MERVKEITFVTGNEGKVATASRILGQYGINVIQHSIHFSEPDASDPKTIAIEKARHASKILGKPLITEDSGFFIYSLGGFPGTNSHHILDEIGVEGIFKKVEGKDRNAEFRSVIAYWEPGMAEPIIFNGVYKGSVADVPWDKEYIFMGWSPLDRIFIPEGFNEPLASPTVRNEFNKKINNVSNFKDLGEYLSKR